ncbi:disease resistance protein RPP13-like [Sorghum bicolor]|uniref:disease resistance protein RPP13-like n=1 Tax=Sorghum bicolor TaxID=4558 RepID=UPI000B425E10|nr:disease resistance protein RPP13-like [Sorghum bicolor]|eukprot:XP_021316871.1 disease resistance protein RPP13-like [Sorghum bicolor]
MSGLEPAIITATAKVAAPILPIAIKAIQDTLRKRQVDGNDITILKSQLSYIQGIILDTRKTIRIAQNPSGRLQSWVRNLSCLAYDIEDLIAGQEAKTKTGAKLNDEIAIIQRILLFINNCPELMVIPDEASLGQRGASSSTSSAQSIPSNPHKEKNFPLADLVGKEEHLRELLGLVRIRNKPTGTDDLDLNLKVMVISVVGFDGVGETKLCHYVYDDVQRNSKFSLYASVSAAGKDGSMVLEEIIKQFHMQEDPTDRTGGLLQRVLQMTFRGDPNNDQVHQLSLSRYLQRKRYFIVVDDVESEELVKFIASVFPDNNMGSRIIMGMMTVVGKDAERCDGHMSKMRPLQDEKSVTWFLNEADQRSTFSEFREQGSSSSCLQKICDGVPLALVCVCEVRGGSISAAAAVEKACRELRTVEKDRWPDIMPVVIPHSYDSLHIRSVVGSCQNQYIPYLQACLLYFAMFPRGNVKRGSLVRRWQAEGLEFGDSNQAGENLKILVDRNFVWPLHVSTNRHQHAKTCQPPGVVLDYISRMSEMEEFIFKSCPSRGPTQNCGRRLCLHPPGEDRPEPLVITNDSVPPHHVCEL